MRLESEESSESESLADAPADGGAPQSLGGETADGAAAEPNEAAEQAAETEGEAAETPDGAAAEDEAGETADGESSPVGSPSECLGRVTFGSGF